MLGEKIGKMVQTGEKNDSGLADKNDSLKVAIQGYYGAFHEIAARKYFQEKNLEIIQAMTFEDVIEMVSRGGDADIGLMAIENTLGGSIMNNYRLLQESNVSVIGEAYLRIKQHLIGLPGTAIQDLKEVHSHPMAIAQCREYFKSYPQIKLIEMEDTALSAKRLSENKNPEVGVIASKLASELYDLELLEESIETHKKNFTRFLVIKDQDLVEINPSKVEKVSVSFSTGHEVGSLYKVLTVLAAYNVNLTKIQSAPIIGHPWEYMFFVDFVIESGKIGFTQAIEAIQPLTNSLKVFGAYQQGKFYEE